MTFNLRHSIIAILSSFVLQANAVEGALSFDNDESYTSYTEVGLTSDADSVEITTTPLEIASEPTYQILTSTKTGYEWEQTDITFNPDPTRAVWMSALFPGLGQLYNRRYWKLPIVIGAYMGLGYATSWNNSMLRDYTKAYRDLTDNDPSTKSYMNFFPSTTDESSLDQTWLTSIMKSRKDYFRRNRDLCIISMVGVYLLAMVDAYVDASLSHFDISPDLTIDWTPRLIKDSRDTFPAIGLAWALTF